MSFDPDPSDFLPPSDDDDDVPLWLEEGLEHIGIPRDYAQGLVDWFGIINPAQMRDLYLTEANLEEMGMLPVHRPILIEAIANGTFDEIGEEDEDEDEDDESLPWEGSDDFYRPYVDPRDYERVLEEADQLLDELNSSDEETKEDDGWVDEETKEDDGWVGSDDFERTNYQPPSELDRMDEETFRIMNEARLRGRKGELRLDVYDGHMYTFDEFQRHYRGSISEWVQAEELDLDERRQDPFSGEDLNIRQFIDNYGGIDEEGIARRTGERHPWFDATPVQRDVEEDSGLPTGLPTLPDSYTVPSEALIRRVLRDRNVRTRLAPNEGLGEPGSFSINDDINTAADRAVERSADMNELNGNEWDPDLSWYSDGIDYLDDESSDNDSDDSDDSDDSADERNRYRYSMGISADAARAAGQAARAAIAAVPADDGDV